MADFCCSDADIGATIASGSFRTMGMVAAPCSLTRAADVCLKARRRVVLMFRETPLHAGHFRAMAQATENGPSCSLRRRHSTTGQPRSTKW